jgi:hypothetical protein
LRSEALGEQCHGRNTGDSDQGPERAILGHEQGRSDIVATIREKYTHGSVNAPTLPMKLA